MGGCGCHVGCTWSSWNCVVGLYYEKLVRTVIGIVFSLWFPRRRVHVTHVKLQSQLTLSTQEMAAMRRALEDIQKRL